MTTSSGLKFVIEMAIIWCLSPFVSRHSNTSTYRKNLDYRCPGFHPENLLSLVVENLPSFIKVISFSSVNCV